jgi:UDP-N-acetylglucosamine 3-dehydrogenase
MNVGLIGCGGMGRIHAAMAMRAGLKIAGCADLVPETVHAFSRDCSVEACEDAQSLITRQDVDVVAITTPTPTHKDLVIAAAQAGKHIFCEKPFCRTTDECRDAQAAVEKAGVKLFVGHVVRYFQEFEAMKAQIDAGKIGKPGFIRMFRGGIFPGGEGSWFHDYAQSGGTTFDMLIHDFDWLRYAFGEPEHVFCQTLMRSEPTRLDYSMSTFKMKSGLIANVIGSWAHPSGFRVAVDICGTGGQIQFDSAESPLAVEKRQRAGSGPEMIVPASPVDVSPYQLEWMDFAAWLNGGTPRVSSHDAIMAVRMAEAALASAASGEIVRF